MASLVGDFDVFVGKEDFKFHCGHFVAFEGFRERLHGHNYRAYVRLRGTSKLGNDGYVVDFGDIKRVTRKLCKELNEHFICPVRSNVIDIEEKDGNVCLRCEDGAYFSMPRGDCAMLPLVHSTAEEIARYLWCRLLEEFGIDWLRSRNVHTVEVTVSEATAQQATFSCRVPESVEQLQEARDFLYNNPPPPRACFCNASEEDEEAAEGGAGA